VAWNRDTHARLWSRAVGTHLHDLGPLPTHSTTVCPGLLGGVETPMALAAGRLFVPVVELCAWESATTSKSAFLRPPAQGKGALYALDAATGETVWRRQLGSPPFGCATVARDAVVAPTYDGTIVAFAAADGRRLWHARLPDGINSCPALGGNLLVVAAGAPYPGLAAARARGRRLARVPGAGSRRRGSAADHEPGGIPHRPGQHHEQGHLDEPDARAPRPDRDLPPVQPRLERARVLSRRRLADASPGHRLRRQARTEPAEAGPAVPDLSRTAT